MRKRFEDGLYGMICGVVIGALSGLGLGTWLLAEPIFFHGDAIVAGAAICGALGFIFGEPFIEWLKGHWWWWFS